MVSVNKLHPPGALPGLLEPYKVRTFEEAELWLLSLAMCVHKGNMTAAAADLGVTRHTIYKKVEKHGLDVNYYTSYNGPAYVVHPFPEPVLNAPVLYPTAQQLAESAKPSAAHSPVVVAPVTMQVTRPEPVNRKIPAPDWLDTTKRAVWSDEHEAFVHPDDDVYMWDGYIYFSPMPDD